MASLPKFLAESRTNAGLSQKDVSNELGYATSQFVSNWERGVSQPPVGSLKRVAAILKIEPKDLLEVIVKDTMEALKEDIITKFEKS